MIEKIQKQPYAAILLLWFCVFISHLGVLYPNIMEARNFITAREMLTDDNWILTTMDGLPRYEKPPLPTWLTAFVGEFTGLENLAYLRLPAALVTLLLLFVMFSLSRKLFLSKLTVTLKDTIQFQQSSTYALIVTSILGTSFYVIFAGRNGTWDIFAHAFMLVGVYFLFQFFENTLSTYRNSLLAGLFIGLSFMSKGPVSHFALLLPFLISYGLIYKFKDFKSKWLPLLIMIIVIAALSSWWAISIYILDTDAATRIAEKESGRWIDYETKPFYYYWSFFTQSGIWSIPAFICLLYPYLKSRVANLKAYQFAILWTLAAVILLSCIPTKKSRYLLPVLIPLAITAGFYIEYLFRSFKIMTNKWESWPVYFNYGLIALIGIVFPVGAYLYLGDNLNDYYVYFAGTSIALIAIGIFIFYHLRKRNFPEVFYATIAFVMFTVLLGFPLSGALLNNTQYKSIASLQQSEVRVLSLDDLAPELVWDYGKTTTHTTEEALLNRTNEEPLLILTLFSQEKNRLNFLKDNNTVEWKGTFDLNPVDSTRSSYKDRLKADYYYLSEK